MKWYWKVRIYRPDGQYVITQSATERTTSEIYLIQDFYREMTGSKLLLEGMSETRYEGIPHIADGFFSLWSEK